MTREEARIGSVEPIDVDWTQDSVLPSNIQVAAFVYDGSLVKQYWNGTAFAAPVVYLSGTFSGSRWLGSFTFPSAAMDKELFFEATATGFTPASSPRTWSRFVVLEIAEDILTTAQIEVNE